MDGIRSWALTVCVSVILSGVLLHAVPKGNLKKCLEFTVVLFVAAAFFMPLMRDGALGIEAELTEQASIDTGALEKKVNDEVVRYVREELQNELTAQAQKIGIELKRVKVEIDYGDSGNVSVKSVHINCILTDVQKREITKLCRELFSQEAQVYFER